MARCASSLLVCAALLVAAAPWRAQANILRGSAPPAHVLLLEDLERALGGGHRSQVEAKVQEAEEAMLPTFRALPRLGGDRLEPGAVRYILHRYFLAKHNWGVFGIGSTGDAWNATSAASAFSAHSPLLEAVFERQIAGGGGLTLRETAMLAATLESLVHEENTARLQRAYRLAGLSAQNDTLAEESAQHVLDVFMLVYIRRLDDEDVGPDQVQARLRRDREISPYWPATTRWLRDVRREVVARSAAERPTSFEALAEVVDEVAGRYGWYANEECAEFKADLRQYERGSTGRVPLTAFYGAALNNGSWQFTESADYLRANGALDESDPERPSVMIPNYMAMPSNCVAGSRYYTVCCTDECEALLGHVEREVQAPEATPALLADVVGRLPSATVPAPRALPAALVGRLEAIAAEHGGAVPLHGRLFSQWMHAAYPRECPFPHLAGKTNTELLQVHEWQEATGLRATLNASAMRAYLRDHAAQAAPEEEEVEAFHPWQPEEELFFEAPRRRPGGLFGLLRHAAYLAAMGSASVALVRHAASAWRGISLPRGAKGGRSEWV